MNSIRNIRFFLLNICFILFSASVFSQSQQVKATRQSALDAFSKGNFEAAYIQFSELSANYPRDPLYKYYCGVSLVKLEKEPGKATSLLKDAKKESLAIRAIPDDAAFYLGRALQMEGNFADAINSFKLFSEQAGKKTAKDYLTSNYIQQCNEKKGAIVIGKPAEKEIIKKDTLPQIKKDQIIKTGKVKNIIPDSVMKKEAAPSMEYVNLLNEALNYQYDADSLISLVSVYRNQLAKTSNEDKAALKARISETEKLAAANQKNADEKLVIAKNYYGQKPGMEILPEKKIKPDSIPSFKESKTTTAQDGSMLKNDTSGIKNESTFNTIKVQNAKKQSPKDTVSKLVENTKGTAQQKSSEIYSVFEIVSKQSYKADEKVPVNIDVEPGLIYRIQVAVFKNLVSPAYFKGITPVYGFRNKGSDVTIYYAGMFRKSADASKSLTQVKSTGFKDAFVVALLDKKIVSAERAVVLEKEWGNKPFYETGIRKTTEVNPDTVPPTLVFRVEVIRTLKPLTAVQVDNIKRLAGNRGLEIIQNVSKQTIYLIGKFLTFESAAEYTDLLTRNGYKEAKVTAYLGRREIPVETAKQLFEKF
jgi:hypothetical protein